MTNSLYIHLTEFVNRFYEMRNIAISKPSFQSSVALFDDNRYGPQRANDGESTLYAATLGAKDNFWMVDLSQRAAIIIVGVNSEKSRHESLASFTIKVGDRSDEFGRSNPPCIGNQRMPDGNMVNFTCSSEVYGRYLTVHQHMDSDQRLRLNEVNAYGIYL